MAKKTKKTIVFIWAGLTATLMPLSGCALLGISEDSSRDPAALMEKQQERVKKALISRELTTGMNMSQVFRVWGQPGDVEVSGARGSGPGGHGNERWTYYDGLSQGLGTSRIVYFEQGKVVGWDTIHPR